MVYDSHMQFIHAVIESGLYAGNLVFYPRINMEIRRARIGKITMKAKP